MTNNDVLKRLRYCYQFNNKALIKLFKDGGREVTVEQIIQWTLAEKDESYINLPDHHLAAFLNGFILHQRGPSDRPMPPAEKKLTNNLILRKIKIALNAKDDDLIELLKIADFKLGKSELSAFFRKPGHKHYRVCKDQILRNLLQGLQMKLRPKAEIEEE